MAPRLSLAKNSIRADIVGFDTANKYQLSFWFRQRKRSGELHEDVQAAARHTLGTSSRTAAGAFYGVVGQVVHFMRDEVERCFLLEAKIANRNVQIESGIVFDAAFGFPSTPMRL